MEFILRALFCLTRGLTLGVTDIMKVSSPAFGKMMFYSSAIPTQAQPLGTSQPLPSTVWQYHLRDTSSLYPNSSLASFPDTTQLWAGGRLQAVDLTGGCCPLSHSPPVYLIKMHWYVRTTLDIHETYTGQHRAYIWFVAKSMRRCGNRNVARQNRATYKINPGV